MQPCLDLLCLQAAAPKSAATSKACCVLLLTHHAVCRYVLGCYVVGLGSLGMAF